MNKFTRFLSFLLALTIVLSLTSVLKTNVSAVTNPYPQYQTINGKTTIACTHYAWNQAYERLGIALPDWGDAVNWYSKAPNNNFTTGTTPRANSIAVWSGPYPQGHVAFVTSVSGSRMTINEGGREDSLGTEGIVTGQGWDATVGVTSYGRTLLGFVYLDGFEENPIDYTAITAGNYYLKHNSTGKYLSVDDGIDADQQNISVANFTGGNEQKLAISAATRGYKLRPHCATRIVNPYGTTVSSGLDICLFPDVADATQWWGFEKVTGGYIIRNIQNQNCVLAVNGTDVVTASYTGAANQLWTLESDDIFTPVMPSHAHPICAGFDCADHQNMYFEAWNDSSHLPTSGNFYLATDVELSQQIDISSTLNLCLNGHVVTAPSGQRHMTISSGGSVAITDCNAWVSDGNYYAGKLTGGSQDYGGSVYIASGGKLDLYGGIISGNNADYGSDVYVADGGIFNQLGGVLGKEVNNVWSVSGTCGENVTWTLANGTLTISGNGSMGDDFIKNHPWWEHKEKIIAVVIESGVTTIGSFAFEEHYNLKSISIPKSVTSIGNGAFHLCTSLTDITIPGNVDTIGRWAFESCSALATVTIENGVTDIYGYAFNKCTSLTSVTIPDSVTSIGEAAFLGCTSLKSITFPDSVTSIERWMFEDCSSLTSVTIPNSVTSIGYGAFAKCASLTDIVIPDSVTNIGDFAFYYCTSLTEITIPHNVTTLSYGAFAHCSSLTAITIPDSVTNPGESLCYGCDSLTSATIENGVLCISKFMFENCANLASISIPISVTSIGEGAFAGCSGLTDVYYNGTQNQWAQITIGDKNECLLGATIHFIEQKSGWVQENGKWYYYKDGEKATGWVLDGKIWYYMNTEGIMQNGWQQIGGTWYYFNASGAMVTGWLQSGSTWYYFNASGAMATGWQQIGGTWYYFTSSGAMATGWLQIGGTWYYFKSSGAMATGWQKVGSTWYFFKSSGAMQTGWLQISGTWYYFKSSGAMQTGWLKLGNTWYYFHSSGAMATSPVTLGGKTYRFDGSGACLNP